MCLNPQRSSRRPPSWIFIHNILFILPLGAEWLEWCSIHSGIGMQHRKTRTFYILVILIPEFWIKKRALSLVAKLILRLIFKRLHPRVSCLHPQRKMRKFRARWRSARANFFHAVLLVVLVLLCDSVALKCGKANQTSRKCAGKIYFLSKELARAAELQEGSAICRVHWDEIRRSNNRCSVPRENHSRVLRKQRIPARLFAVLDAIGATCHVMSCHVKMAFGTSIIWFLLSQFSLSTLYRRNGSNACTVIALLLAKFSFLHKSALSLSKYMSLLLN